MKASLSNYIVQSIHGHHSIVMSVHTDLGEFKMVNRRDFSSQDSSIVWVEAEKFLKLWRNEDYGIHEDVSHGTPETWRKDYKFHEAERGFKSALNNPNNPVPLAHISCNEHLLENPIYAKRLFFFRRITGYTKQRNVYVSYIDGITRSIWLMANGCKEFPIQCLKNESDLLHQHAGVEGIPPVCVATLLNSTVA
jgi:hypothetical protein